jgi:uncharacterized protein
VKHNILSFVIMGLLMFFVAGGCTDYTSNIQGTSNTPGTEPKITDGNNQLPSDLLKPNEGEFTEKKMLANIGLNIISKNVEDFYIESKKLNRVINDRCDELNFNKNQDNNVFENVRTQWESTMLAYHRVDAIAVGPINENADGGTIARNIYSWPYINTCGIDLEVARMSTGSSKATPVSQLPVNKKGLAALEYLFYSPVTESGCVNLGAIINKDAAEWLNRDELQKKKDRCDFAQQIVNNLEDVSRTLYSRWNPDSKNYTKTLVDNSLYPTTKEAINALSDALFSIEFVKDDKVGKPLGLMPGCNADGGLCPELVEHKLSRLSLRAIAEQVDGFKEAFFGSKNILDKAFGFDDYLISKGYPDAVVQFKAEINTVETTLKIIEQKNLSLEELVTITNKSECSKDSVQLSSQPACLLFFQLRQLSNLLKVDMLTLLALDAPAGFQGDSD